MTPPMPSAEVSGARHSTLVEDRDFAEHRLASLAEAIRQHEGTIRGPTQHSRPQDRRLYKRLSDICSERPGQ